MSSNAGKYGEDDNDAARSPDTTSPSVVRADGKRAEDYDEDVTSLKMPRAKNRPKTGNAGVVPDDKKPASKKPSPSTMPGAVQVEGDEEEAARQKAKADGLGLAPAYHPDTETSEISRSDATDVRLAAAAHTHEEDSKPKARDKKQAGPRAKTPGAITEDSKPAAVKKTDDDHDEGALSTTLGAAVAPGAARKKKGRRNRKDKGSNGDEATENSSTTGHSSPTNRETRNGGNINEDDYSDESTDDEEEASILPGATRVPGITSTAQPAARGFERVTAVQETAPETFQKDLVQAVAIDEDEENNRNLDFDPESADKVIEAVQVDGVEKKTGVMGFISRHPKMMGFVGVVVIIVTIVSIVYGLRAGNGPDNPDLTTDAIYQNGTARFQEGADLLQSLEVSTREDLLAPDRSTPQYLALTWLADEDGAQVELGASAVQRYVLAVLHFAAGGDGWFDSLNFTSSSNECEWNAVRAGGNFSGVKCNEEGFVTELVLDSNNLTGVLPNEFGQLTSLTEVDFSYNKDLVGTLPETISMLQNMEIFRFVEANFTGTLPDGIGALTGLVELHADGNALIGGIPSTVGQLTQLQVWSSERNDFSGSLPDEMGAMSSLRQLYLRDNTFAGSIPSTFTALTSLQELDISFNDFVDGAQNICNIEGQELTLFYADCFAQTVPAIPEQIKCACCTKCCSETFGDCVDPSEVRR